MLVAVQRGWAEMRTVSSLHNRIYGKQEAFGIERLS